MAVKVKGSKRSVWDKDARPYGTYEGPRGNPEVWRAAFEEAMYGRERSLGILAGVTESPREILGVSADATAEEIKRAWRKLVLKHHPDHGGDREQFERVMAAYSILAGAR